MAGLAPGQSVPSLLAASLVLDLTLDVPECASCLHDPGLGGQGRLPHGPEEVDLQLNGRECLAFTQRGGVGKLQP